MCKNSHFTHIDCGEKRKRKNKKKISPHTPLIKKNNKIKIKKLFYLYTHMRA